MSERTTHLMKQWRERAIDAEAALVKANSIGERADLIAERDRAQRLRVAAEAKLRRVAMLADRWEEAAGTDRDNESRCLRDVAAYLRAALGVEREHHPDCPTLYGPQHVDRCRCVFLEALDRLEGK